MVDFATIGPDEPGYPWDFPALHVANYPTPSMFVDLNNRTGWFQHWQGFDVLVRVALGSALLLADMPMDLAEANTSNARRLRQSMRSLILGRWNAELYSCSNENYCGGTHPQKLGGYGHRAVVGHMMSRGLGINWMPRHADNLLRMRNDLPAQRTTSIRGEVLPGTLAHSRALLWTPAVDLDALQADPPIIRALVRADGSSTQEPPAVVRELGIDHPLSLPGMPGFDAIYKGAV